MALALRGRNLTKSKLTMKETYEELDVTVVYTSTSSVSVSFEVYDIMARDTKETIFYEGIGGCGADDKMTEEIEQANKYIQGTVKWDGCSHVNFGDEDGYIHLCGSKQFTRIGKILEKVYQRCYEIGNFNYDPLTPTTP